VTVRVVTDSNTMVPAALAASLALVVVPLTVTIGGDELVEDATIDVADAYRRLRAGEPATTSAPSPGAFAEAYRAIGDDPIVSVHIGSAYSGTLDAARLGASVAGVEVRFVDTATASFLAGCCAIAAAEAARAGADLMAVAETGQRTAAQVVSIFTLAELERGRAGGRLDVEAGEGAPVLRMDASGITAVGNASHADEAAAMMIEHLAGVPGRQRIGVGDADAGPVVDELVERLRVLRPDDDVIRYVVGPTVAAHAGMGTFGIVHHPLADDTR